MLKRMIINKFLKTIGIILVIFSLSIIVYKYYEIHKEKAGEKEAINNFFEEIKEEIIIEQDDEEPVLDEVVQEETTVQNISYEKLNYIAVLQIPKINLERGLVDRNSRYNNVNSNIAILKESSMPDEENSTLILASHAGSSRVAFFNNLYKLEKNDIVYLSYKGIKYSYVVDSITEVKKDGNISIQRTTQGKRLILVTCKLKEKKQIVVVCKLIESNPF